MPYNKFEVLIRALDHVKHRKQIHLNIAGENFEPVLKELESKVSFSYHGKLSYEELIKMLGEQDVGIITGGREHTSFMKLPEYGAARLCVIAPAHQNLKEHYSDDILLYFKNEDPVSLAARLDELVENRELLTQRGEDLYKLIKEKYTWEQIYAEVGRKMKQIIEET